MKKSFDVYVPSTYSANNDMSENRTNKPTNMTLRPVVKKAAKKYCRETGKALSTLTDSLLEKFFLENGYLPKPTK